MSMKGKIASWKDDKGYGFITPLEGGKQIFVHVKALGSRNRRPEVGDVLTYSISEDRKGRPCAVKARLASDKRKVRLPFKSKTAAIVFSVLSLAAIGLSAMTRNLPTVIFIEYTALSLITFAAYAWDKSAARRGAWRTSEGTLLLLGLAGGWPGALIAQETLRHKSKKASFRTLFFATVLVNCTALFWFHTDAGQEVLQDFIAQGSLMMTEAAPPLK